MAYTQKNNPFKKIENPTDSDKQNYVEKMGNRGEAVNIAKGIVKDADGLLGKSSDYNIRRKLFNSSDSVNRSGEKTYQEDVDKKVPKNAYGPVDRLMQMDEKDIEAFKDNISDAVSQFEGLNFKDNPGKVISTAYHLNMDPFKEYLEKADIDGDELSDIIAAQLKDNKNLPNNKFVRGLLNKAIKLKINQLE